MEQSAIRCTRSTVTDVHQTAAENFFIFAILFLTVTRPACNSGPRSLLNLGQFEKFKS
jgi:hypothetical protein